MTGECWGGPWDGLRHSYSEPDMRPLRGPGRYRWRAYAQIWEWEGPE